MPRFLLNIIALVVCCFGSIALAASAQFSSSPIPAEFERYLEKADLNDIRSSYAVIPELNFVDATKKGCAEQKYFLDRALAAHPFGLALIRLAWHCAKVSGEAKMAAALALRFDAVLAMYLIENDGKFLSSAIPVNSFWDIIAIADAKNAKLMRGEFSFVMNLGDLSYYCWLKYPDQHYELLHFNLSENLIRAGRTQKLHSTPAARMFLIADLVQNLADEGVVEAEGFQIKQNASSGTEAVEGLRERYTFDVGSVRIALPLLSVGMAKCNEADAKALGEDAKSLQPAALINLALERVLGLCSAADVARADELLRQAQTKTQVSVIALIADGLLTANAFDKLPISMLAQLRVDAVRDPRAASVLFIQTKSAEDLKLLSQNHRSVQFVSVMLDLMDAQTAAEPEMQKQAFCKAAKFGNPVAMRKCAGLLNANSELSARIELEKAGLFSMPSTDTKSYFSANRTLVGELFQLKRFDEALNWAVSAVVLGDKLDFKVGVMAAMGGKLNTLIDQDVFLLAYVSDAKTRKILKRQFALGEAHEYATALNQERQRCHKGLTIACYAIVMPVVSEIMGGREYIDAAGKALERVWEDDPEGKFSPAALFYVSNFFAKNSKIYDPIAGANHYEKLLDPTEYLQRNWAQVRCTASDKKAFAPKATLEILESLVATGEPDFLDTAAACYAALGQFDRAKVLVGQALAPSRKNNPQRIKFLNQRLALFSKDQRVATDYSRQK